MAEDLRDRRIKLSKENLKAWEGICTFKVSDKPDASLKKNSAFIKKLKSSLNAEQYENIVKEIGTLTLEKYVSEIVQSVCEGLYKVSKGDDIIASMGIVSALHQRFTTRFTPSLLKTLLNALALQQPLVGLDPNKDKEYQQHSTKQKNIIKLLMEFYIIGIIGNVGDFDKDTLPEYMAKKYVKTRNEPVVLSALKTILSQNLKLGASLGLVQSFLKRFKDVIYDDCGDFLCSEVKKTFQQIFSVYTYAVYEVLVELHRSLLRLQEKNRKASIRTGRILDENLNEIQEVESLCQKFRVASETLSSATGIKMPELTDENIDEETSTTEVVKSKTFGEDDLGIWSSTKEKFFYTRIPDISDLTNGEETGGEGTSGERINEFMLKLEAMETEEDVDNLVKDFIFMDLNNKATRNRLTKFFMETPNLMHLSFYARFLKISEPILNDLIVELINYLDRSFRSQLHNNRLNFKNIVFFCELIKFKLIPTHLIFHKIRSLTINISSTNNIDILSVFYEQCGTFLLHEPEYKDLMVEMIELLKLKQRNDKLSANDKLAIRNLLLIVQPLTTKLIRSDTEYQELSPEQKFIIRLIRYELKDSTFNLVVKSLSKFELFSNDDLFLALLEVFSRPDLINHDNLQVFCKLLLRYCSKNKSIYVMTIDTVTERIIRGLELNDYRMNRSSITNIMFIKEVYNLRLLSFRFILDLLYKILSHGHEKNQPLPLNYLLEADLPNNYFRIQLCCILLNGINIMEEYFHFTKSGKAYKRKTYKQQNQFESFENFMTFLQYYCYCKEQPLPIELTFLLNDVFEKYSPLNIERFKSLDESVLGLQRIMQRKEADLSNTENNKGKHVEEEYEEGMKDDMDVDGDVDVENFEDDYEDGFDDDDYEDDDDDDDEQDLEEDDEDEEEHTDVTANSDLEYDSDINSLVSNSDDVSISEQETDSDKSGSTDENGSIYNDERDLNELEEKRRQGQDFDKEFQKLVLDSYENNKATVSIRNKLNVPLPSNILASQQSDTSKVNFGLLTKFGKKNTVKKVNLLSDNRLTESLLREKEVQKTHRERVVRLVMNMEDH